jgi:RluA family pseudouridine synthase
MKGLRELVPVVFEDESLIAFNKPSGLLVAPDRWDKTIENLMDMVHQQESPDWFNVHRIDRATSGLVLCAKTKRVLDAVCAQFETRAVEKTYLALVRGCPPESRGVIDQPLAPSPQQPNLMRVSPSGKPAETAYEVVERWHRLSLLHLRPHTGRTHQLRVHCAWMKCPIVADNVYGSERGLFLSDFKRKYKEGQGPERPLMGRLALHAWKLTLVHPVSGLPLTLEAPPTKDFGATLNQLRRHGRMVPVSDGDDA